MAPLSRAANVLVQKHSEPPLAAAPTLHSRLHERGPALPRGAQASLLSISPCPRSLQAGHSDLRLGQPGSLHQLCGPT